MPNSASNVTQGKPKVTGAIFRAPFGTALPTDAKTALDKAFVCLGYASEDGMTNSNGIDTETTKAWGGDTVLSSLTGKTDEWKTTLIESLNVEVLKTVFGDENVIGDLETGITVKSVAAQPESACYVVDMILKGNVMKRVVIPDGSISSIDDVTYSDSAAVGYGITIACVPDAEGVTHYEYISKPAAAGESK